MLKRVEVRAQSALLRVSERPQIEASAFLQLDEDPVEAGGMAIEPTGVLQPLHGQVDRDRAAPERIGRRRKKRRDLIGEGRDGTTRVPGSDRRGGTRC